MRASTCAGIAATMLVASATAGLVRLPSRAAAATVTFSGTITYDGTHSGDTLFVAALDTTGTEDVTLLDLQTIAVGPSPLSQPYSLTFDNTGVGMDLFVASFLDVDGGGIDSVGGGDVFGWYAGGPAPTAIPPDSSQSGLDFALPRAEIHGTVALTAGQTEARIDVTGDPACILEGFRPGTYVYASGPYSILGIYPGTWCVNAVGFDSVLGSLRACYGDPDCVTPSLLTLSATDVVMGIDLDFTAITAVESHSWGSVKALYR